jgi:serine/threonine-protein kinase
MSAQATAPMVVSADLAALLAVRGHHPNLVRILGVHHSSGRAELMVEYVHGRSLAALLAAAGPERMPLAEALTIARDVARGLFFLHSLRDDQGRSYGFVHGGLTPGKIIVGFDGVARIAGLERVAATEGVPPPDRDHAPPEQLVHPHTDDRRIDVFAVGAILLRMVSGLRLVDGAIPPVPTPDLPGCPGGLEQILRRALARDPARRYASAEELRAALEGFAVREGHPLDAQEVGKLVRRLLPEAMNEPAGRLIPPRPDRSMWTREASRWAPVESRLDFGAGGLAGARAAAPTSPAAASAATAASAAAAAAAAASLTAPGVAVLRRVSAPNPLVPAAASGAATMTVAALDDRGEPMLPADAAAVLDELAVDGHAADGGVVDGRHPGGRLAPSPAGRIPPTGYMPGLEPPAPAPRSAPYPAPPLALDPRADFLMVRAPAPDRWRWLPTRSVAGTVALLLFLFAAAVAIAYVASG